MVKNKTFSAFSAKVSITKLKSLLEDLKVKTGLIGGVALDFAVLCVFLHFKKICYILRWAEISQLKINSF